MGTVDIKAGDLLPYLPIQDELSGQNTGVLVNIGESPLSWGSVVSVSGNMITLNPCDSDGTNINTSITITTYALTPTGATPNTSKINTNDVLSYIPYGTNLGVLVNANISEMPSNANKSKYMVIQMSADNITSPDNASLWTVDYLRAH